MNRLAELRAMFDDPSSLSDDELVTAREELRQMGLDVRDGTIGVDDPVETITEIVAHFEGVQFVLDERAARRAAFDELSAKLDTPAKSKPTKVPALSALSTPPGHEPATRVTVGEPRIMRAHDWRDGDEVTMDAVLEDFVGRLQYLADNPRGSGEFAAERFPVARIKVGYPEERTLRPTESSEAQNAKIDALTADAWKPEKWQDESLVASGGFCGPSQPDYSQLVVAGTQRPVAGYLPTVRADRGSIVVTQPFRLSDVVSSAAQGAGSAVSVWTNTIDTTPGGTTKPKQTLPCPSPITVTTEAIVERVRIGNFGNMAFPENVQAFLNVVAAAWARRAESELLRQIDANTAITAVTTTQVLGATADYLGYASRPAASIRNRQRMPHDAQLRLLVPAWIVDLFAADQAHAHAGDGLDRFTVTEATVRSWFAARNIGVTFYEDSANMTTGNVANQLFTGQSAGDLENWPPTSGGVTNARVISYLFPEGTFARADAGSLELGVIRDTVLNDTNDFEFFSESLEAIVPKVIDAYKWTATVCESGTGSSDSSASGYCTAS